MGIGRKISNSDISQFSESVFGRLAKKTPAASTMHSISRCAKSVLPAGRCAKSALPTGRRAKSVFSSWPTQSERTAVLPKGEMHKIM
jgi:hypothetical protein